MQCILLILIYVHVVGFEDYLELLKLGQLNQYLIFVIVTNIQQ